VTPDRLSVAGYAEHRPVADNATPEGRAANRRVDIVVVGRQVAAAQEPPLPRP
jgi:chemotaxis protein MotB